MDTAILIKLLTVIALTAMMLSIGMKVSYEQVLASARDIRLVASGILANFVLVPLVTVGLLYGFQAPPLVSAGFLILAVCPGAPVVPPFTAIARGDVSLATGLMVILAALSALLAPGLLTFLVSRLSPESDLRIIAFAWQGSGGERLLVAVNYAPESSQCYVRLPFDDLGGRIWLLQDRLSTVTYDRDGENLESRGLFLDVPPWHGHVFEMTASL